MRKVLLLALLLLCVSGLFAQFEYPVNMNNGTLLINTGIGLGSLRAKSLPKLPMACPFVLASIDAALPIAGLPLTIGLITGYFAEKDKVNDSYRYDFLPVGLRIAYHLNFNVPRLDTYVLLTMGAGVLFHKDHISGRGHAIPWIGVSAGASYFFHPSVGAFAELGLDAVQCFSVGLSFKI